MASDKQVNELIDALRESGGGGSKIEAAINDMVFECKAKEAAAIARSLHESLSYIIDCMGPRLAKKTLVGISSRR